jgi:hypothetical protein
MDAAQPALSDAGGAVQLQVVPSSSRRGTPKYDRANVPLPPRARGDGWHLVQIGDNSLRAVRVLIEGTPRKRQRPRAECKLPEVPQEPEAE